MHSIRSGLAILAAMFLTVAAAGCGDAFGVGDGRVEGRYDYTGTVDGAPFYYLDGEIRVRNQRGDEADVDIDWVMRDERGGVIYSIRSSSPARAYVDRDYIRFDFEGWLEDDRGQDINFVLEHEGEVRGRTMVGNWDLFTDGFGNDRGTFRGTR